MFYTGRDSAQFLAQTDYIDTAIVPLIPVQLTKETMQNGASQADYILSLANALENQFKGRVVAFPSFSYVLGQSKEQLLLDWKTAFAASPFKHILFLTGDAEWNQLDPSVFWTATIPLDSMEPKLRGKILEDQVRQLIPRIAETWNSQS